MSHEITQTNESLCLLIQSGDQQAKQDICIKNERLVKKVADKYVGAYGNDMSREDLIQEGYIGLLTAAEKYDVNSDVKFSTYAVHWIKREIMHEIKAHGFSIRLPEYLMNSIAKCMELDTSYMQQGLDRGERLQAIADTLDISVEDVKKCLSMHKQYHQTVSLNTVIEEKNLTEIQELIADEDTPLVEDECDRNALRERIRSLVEELNPQERDIIKLRYGFIDNRVYTLDEVGTMYGIGVERVRQIEEKALRRLRFSLSDKKSII